MEKSREAKTWTDIVFADGDDYYQMIDEVGDDPDSMIDYLSQWDYGDGGEERSESPAGASDYVHTKGNYELSYNPSLGYAGLSRVSSRNFKQKMRRSALGRRKRSFGNERFRLTNDNGEVIEGSAWELGEMGYWEWADYDDEGEYGHLWDALNAGDMYWANEISRNLGIRVEEIS